MSETLTRTISGIVYIALLVTATLYFNTLLLLFGIFLLIAVVEFCDLIQLKKVFPVSIALCCYLLFSYFKISKTTEVLLLSAALFVSAQSIILLFNDAKQKMDKTAKYVYLIGYIVIPFILITKISMLHSVYNPKIIITLFILIWTNDTFAFLVGKSFGKTKLFERISPKKTIEGFIGGLCFAIIFSILLAVYFIKQPVFMWVIISIIISIFGTIGDLIESKFKRMAGVKDSGKIMPGHGGILDRLDSVIFATPFLFLFYQILYYVS